MERVGRGLSSRAGQTAWPRLSRCDRGRTRPTQGDAMTAGRGVDVYAHANPFFVRAVRGHPGRAEVLDIGCWNGTLGREIMQECDAVVDGIERDAVQAEGARVAGYRRVDIVDLDLRIPVADGRLYDFLLFGDVLEHLVHPERVLAELVTRLLGRWDYKDYGILDRTHLRFFTKRSMVALIEGAGLRVIRIDGYVGLHKYRWFVREPLRWLGRAWPSMFAIQIVLEAEPAAARMSSPGQN